MIAAYSDNACFMSMRVDRRLPVSFVVDSTPWFALLHEICWHCLLAFGVFSERHIDGPLCGMVDKGMWRLGQNQ
jgi:hypothetical protein